jgi:hypothetical protein
MAWDLRRFDLVAESQILLDDEVAACWELVRAGIKRRLLVIDHLATLIDQLRAGCTVTLDDLVFERDPAGDRLCVVMLDDRRTCSAAAMIDELARLARRIGATVPIATVPIATVPIATIPLATPPIATIPLATPPIESEAERDLRLRSEARAAISARLKLPPST